MLSHSIRCVATPQDRSLANNINRHSPHSGSEMQEQCADCQLMDSRESQCHGHHQLAWCSAEHHEEISKGTNSVLGPTHSLHPSKCGSIVGSVDSSYSPLAASISVPSLSSHSDASATSFDDQTSSSWSKDSRDYRTPHTRPPHIGRAAFWFAILVLFLCPFTSNRPCIAPDASSSAFLDSYPNSLIPPTSSQHYCRSSFSPFLQIVSANPFYLSADAKLAMRDKVRAMFYHGYER